MFPERRYTSLFPFLDAKPHESDFSDSFSFFFLSFRFLLKRRKIREELGKVVLEIVTVKKEKAIERQSNLVFT